MSTDSSVDTLLNDEAKDIDWVDTGDTAALDTLEAVKLNGKTVTVAVDTDHCHWPSDTSLPLGAPRCANEVAVIG